MATKTVIQLSDLHLGRGKKEEQNLRTVFGRIARSYPGVPVLITGDLTDSATKGQFKKMRAHLNTLAHTNPILAVPGNHDYAWKGIIMLRRGSWKEWVKYLGTPLGWGRPPTPWMEPTNEPVGVDGVGVWKDGPVVFFGVDSGDPDDHEHTSRGWISKKLAQGLKAALEKYDGKTRIVLVHHHPFIHGQFMKMAGAKRFMDALKDNCELLLFGHKHRYGLWWQRDTIPLTVASHKTTNPFSGDCMAITVFEIENAGTPNLSIRHRLDVLS